MADSGRTSLKCQCYLSAFLDRLQDIRPNLQEEHFNLIDGLPFAHFFYLKDTIKGEEVFLDSLVGSYDGGSKCFRIGNKSVKFSAEELCLILGLKLHGGPVTFENKVSSTRARYLKQVALDREHIWKAVHVALRQNDVEGVVKLLILALFVCFLFPTPGGRISPGLCAYVDNLNSLGGCAWGAAVYSWLMEELPNKANAVIRRNNGESVAMGYLKGCTQALQVWVKEHSGTCWKKSTRIRSPRMLNWEMKGKDLTSFLQLTREEVSDTPLKALRCEQWLINENKQRPASWLQCVKANYTSVVVSGKRAKIEMGDEQVQKKGSTSGNDAGEEAQEPAAKETDDARLLTIEMLNAQLQAMASTIKSKDHLLQAKDDLLRAKDIEISLLKMEIKKLTGPTDKDMEEGAGRGDESTDLPSTTSPKEPAGSMDKSHELPSDTSPHESVGQEKCKEHDHSEGMDEKYQKTEIRKKTKANKKIVQEGPSSLVRDVKTRAGRKRRDPFSPDQQGKEEDKGLKKQMRKSQKKPLEVIDVSSPSKDSPKRRFYKNTPRIKTVAIDGGDVPKTKSWWETSREYFGWQLRTAEESEIIHAFLNMDMGNNYIWDAEGVDLRSVDLWALLFGRPLGDQVIEAYQRSLAAKMDADHSLRELGIAFVPPIISQSLHSKLEFIFDDRVPGLRHKDFKHARFIFMPINTGFHWILLEIDYDKRTMTFKNSLQMGRVRKESEPCDENEKFVLQVATFLGQCLVGKYALPSTEDFTIKFDRSFPQQPADSVACGVYVMKAIEDKIFGGCTGFTHDDINAERSKYAAQILRHCTVKE